MRIGIDTQMQLAPTPTGSDAVFLIEPFALAVDLQTDAVDQQMQWLRVADSLQQNRHAATWA